MKRKTAIILGILIFVLSIGLWHFYFPKPQNTPTQPSPSLTPPQKIQHNTFQNKQNDKQYILKALSLLDAKKYYEALYFLQKAEKMHPKDAEIKFYLLETYLHIEKEPYQAGSKSLQLAIEIISLDEDGKYTPLAYDVINHHKKKVSSNVEKKPPTAKPKKKRAIPVISLKPPYPVRKPKAPLKHINKKISPTSPKKKPKPQYATLKGYLERLDERGLPIRPEGVEISLIDLGGSQEYTTTTGKDGKYVFKNIPLGREYAIVALSQYKYYQYIREFFPIRRPYTYSTTSYNINIDPYGGYVHHPSYFSNNPYMLVENRPSGSLYYYDYTHAVEKEYNTSWHLRTKIDKAGTYIVNLTPDNADKKFLNDIEPNYDPVTYEPYEEITDVIPAYEPNE